METSPLEPRLALEHRPREDGFARELGFGERAAPHEPGVGEVNRAEPPGAEVRVRQYRPGKIQVDPGHAGQRANRRPSPLGITVTAPQVRTERRSVFMIRCTHQAQLSESSPPFRPAG